MTPTRDEEAMQRVSGPLRAALTSGGTSPLAVVIRLVAEDAAAPLATGGKPAVELERRFAERARPLLELLNRRAAAEVRLLWIADAVAARVPPAAVPEIAQLELVREVQLDERVVALAGPPDEEE